EPGFPIGRRPFVVSLEPSPASSIERAMRDLSDFEFHGEPPLALPVFSAEAVPGVAGAPPRVVEASGSVISD
ncbi:MAG: hypothetical protein ACJ731_15260, partial [Vicinamibacterales bacterium]